MNILLYSLNFVPERTGTSKYSGEMAEWLVTRGHSIEVICGLPHYPDWKLYSAYSGGRSRRESRNGVIINRAPHFIPQAGKLGARSRILMETSFSVSAGRYWLRKLTSKSKPDLIIAVMPPMQIGVWPLLYFWIRHVPWILHVQDLQVDAAIRLNMLPSGIVGHLLYRIEKFFLRRATRVSTITEAMRKRITSKGVREDRTLHFPNWADVKGIQPGERDNTFRKSLHIGAGKCVVLYAGNMGEKQGLEIVLQAAKELQARKDIVFLMVGGGAAKTTLEQLSKSLELDNVRFLPVQPAERLPGMLAAGDIHLVVQKRNAADLVMPSKLTNVLASGRPCIATAEPGTALYGVVEENSTGLVTPPEDAAALARAIEKLAGDNDLRRQFGRAARNYAEKCLDQDSILGEFEKHLSTLIEKEPHD